MRPAQQPAKAALTCTSFGQDESHKTSTSITAFPALGHNAQCVAKAVQAAGTDLTLCCCVTHGFRFLETGSEITGKVMVTRSWQMAEGRWQRADGRRQAATWCCRVSSAWQSRTRWASALASLKLALSASAAKQQLSFSNEHHFLLVLCTGVTNTVFPRERRKQNQA